MSQSIDDRLVLDNVVSMLEHCVVHISDPSAVFLQQVESDVVRLIFSGASEVSVTIHLFYSWFSLSSGVPRLHYSAKHKMLPVVTDVSWPVGHGRELC